MAIKYILAKFSTTFSTLLGSGEDLDSLQLYIEECFKQRVIKKPNKTLTELVQQYIAVFK